MAGRTQLTALVSGLAATTMLFAAFASAYVVRRGLADNWTPVSLPAALYWSVLPGAAVVLVLETSRRSITTALAIVFAAMHIYAWQQLGSPGTAAAFVLVLDGAFLVYVAAGIIALLVGVCGAAIRYYWLYLNVLWIIMLALLHFWP
jgi:cytochrome c oxidase subunit III